MAMIHLDHENSSTDARAFACPGLYRIVPAQDGGICRVRVPLGTISPRQLRAVATVAETNGNGIVELTNRANLQIRGMPIGNSSLLIGTLVDAGLAPRERWADDTRNVLINPSAGRDPLDIIDVRPFALGLLEALSTRSAFASLSPKFSIQLDGRGAMSVTDHPHDIWLLAVATDRRGVLFEMGLAGAIGERADDSEPRFIVPQDIVEVVCALIGEFLDRRKEVKELSRMRDLIRLIGRTEIWRRLERRIGRSLPSSVNTTEAPIVGTRAAPVGIIAQREPGRCFVGALPRLGRIDFAAVRALAEVCEDRQLDQIVLTPWRSILVPDVDEDRATELAEALRALDLCVDARDPIARLIACSGNVGCSSGRTDVQGDAHRLAARLGRSSSRQTIHLSGCSKSCAVPGTSDLTLVARENGLYDLYRRESLGNSRFGVPVANSIDIDRACKLLAGASV